MDKKEIFALLSYWNFHLASLINILWPTREEKRTYEMTGIIQAVMKKKIYSEKELCSLYVD